jgi:hypothetical protein
MSLINDALKRAGQKPASSPSPSELSAGLRPAEETPARFPVLTLLIVLIPLIALGVWFLTKGLQLDEPAKPVATEARVPERPSAPAIVAPTNAPAPQPTYKLQGIYWRPSRPSAVINGKTVYIGNRVENARVTAIDQESVTITVHGETKVLSLR